VFNIKISFFYIQQYLYFFVQKKKLFTSSFFVFIFIAFVTFVINFSDLKEFFNVSNFFWLKYKKKYVFKQILKEKFTIL